MTEVSVVTNSFFITRLPTKDYLQYDVAFRPDIDIANKRERVMHMLQTSVAPNLFNPRGLYDGRKLLYLSHRLHLPGGGGGASFTVRLGNDPNAPIGSPGVFEVLISKTASDVIRPIDLNRLIAAPNQAVPNDPKAATAMNLLQLLIRQSSNQNHPTNNGRAYFSPEGRKSLQNGIELWRGFYQSVRPTIGRMIVTIDTAMAAVYESGPLLNVAMNVLGVKDVRELTFDESHPKFHKLQSHFKNRQITTAATRTATKTIRGLIPGPIGRYSFSKEGRKTTIEAWLLSPHNKTLRYPGTFGVLIARRPFPVIIPAELCSIIPGQLYKKKLPATATAAAVDFATQRPQDRLKSITGGRSGVPSPIQGYGTSEYVVDAGMVINPQPISLKAKLLAHPRIEFGGSDLMPQNGAWNAVNRQFFSPKRLGAWAVANFDGRISPNLVDKVIRDSSFNMTMTVSTRDVYVNSERCLPSLTVLEDVENPAQVLSGDGHHPTQTLEAIGHAMKGKVELIVVILPSKADEIRNKVKYWGDVVRGVKTSCLREDKLHRANNQYWTNVAISGHYAVPKMPIELSRLKSSGPFMILGCDVGHPSPGLSRPSIASLVFSWDAAATRYAAYSEVQSPRQEIIPGLQAMVKKAILAFGENNPPPGKLIFYRDGVSEGEMEAVKVAEISAIRNACMEVWEGRKVRAALPTITFICVVKRHHAIFIPNDARVDDGKTGNCRAGLIVDQMRSPIALDFYLQSHAAIKGTSRSGHYSVLLDENFNNDVSRIQQLSFELCHVYAKATRSISIPAPVYYADMVCARAKFQVDPNSLDYEATTNASGSEDFDLDYWKAAYRPVNDANHYDKGMYFL
ncbi:Argonaute-like protein [Mycena sanguinolenta]|uniref:Argonaute-like protein n=1 Tax=Mycena sanguinolenta TaxID=230812 RepID=A0A8H6YDZ8_9AGAR|nr:Argonaute-like protein [Mycena sanguinolenta]